MAIVIGATVGLVFSVVVAWWATRRDDGQDRRTRTTPGMTAPPKPPPPPKPPQKKLAPPVTQQWYRTVQTAIESTGGAIYREDFRVDEAVDYIDQAAATMGLSTDEVAEMKEHLRNAVSELPEKPPEQDDVCPECGNMFAVTDDYLCAECRARIG